GCRLRLAERGRASVAQCNEPVQHLYGAERVLTNAQRRPEGALKISVPVILGDYAFLTFISDFAKSYPGIRIDLYITNQFLDLIAENVDVAVRFGELKSSSVVARKLGRTVRYGVAAPDYLAGQALPAGPGDHARTPW